MAIFRKAYVNTSAQIDTIVLSHDVKRAVTEAAVSFGTVLIYVPVGTGAVTVLENDPKIYEDYKKYIAALIPSSSEPRPNRRSGSGRTFAHLRAKTVGYSVVLPIAEGKLQIGPWQEILFFDFDDHVGRREVFILVSGEGTAAGLGRM